MTESHTSSAPIQKRPLSAWSNPAFRLFTLSGLILSFVTQTQSLMIGWQVYEIKKDPLYLGFIGLTEALPALSLALLAGYIVDLKGSERINRMIFWLALLVSATLTLVMSTRFLPGHEKILSDDALVATLYAVAFLGGIARGFRGPTRTAMIPRLVSRDALAQSSAWNTTMFSLSSASGPALGGLLYAATGNAFWGYLIGTLLCVVALVMTYRIEVDQASEKLIAAAESVGDVLNELTLGLKFVFTHPLLLPALALDMFGVLFGGAVALLPVFSAEILHTGAWGVGILRGGSWLGSLAGSLWLIRFPLQKKSGTLLLVAVFGFGFCMIGFGLSTQFWLSLTLLALSGVFDSVSMVIRGTIVQMSAPENMRGRVGAVNSLFINISNQLGEFESGVAAKLMGTARSVVFGGVVTLIVVLVTGFKAKTLRKMEIEKL